MRELKLREGEFIFRVGTPFTSYQEFFPILDVSVEFSSLDNLRKHVFAMKTMVSEVGFRKLHSNDRTNLATELILKTAAPGYLQ